MLFIYLAILVVAMFWVIKILGPEMAKPSLPKTASGSGSLEHPPSEDTAQRTEKLQTLLSEKNRTIDLLETELKVYQAQATSFDKLKTLLEGEIQRLREQNRIFRSELGLPAVQPKENSIK